MDSLMSKYRWYEEIQNSASLSQGDILFKCQIILPTEDVYNSLLDENYEPEYREHLSQAFARYFMRVGLPVDIDREEIKEY